MQNRRLPLRWCFLMDNDPDNSWNLDDKLSKKFYFIKIKFFPAKTTPLLQPMDKQMIYNFKKLCIKNLFFKDSMSLVRLS